MDRKQRAKDGELVSAEAKGAWSKREVIRPKRPGFSKARHRRTWREALLGRSRITTNGAEAEE